MKKIVLPNRPVGPFPAMLVGATVDSRPNYATVGAGGCACLEPVLAVSLKDGHFTTQGVRQTGFFSVNIPSPALLQKTDYCGLTSGWDMDKSPLFSAFFDPAGDAPLIEECALNFLCKVCDTKEIRGFTMFFGDIVAAYADEDCLTEGQPDPIKIDPIIMMGFSYCSLKDVIGHPFAEGKKLLEEK